MNIKVYVSGTDTISSFNVISVYMGLYFLYYVSLLVKNNYLEILMLAQMEVTMKTIV